MKKEFLAVLSLVAISTILILVYPIFSVNSAPASLFNVTPDVVFINWTNSYAPNISIGVSTAFGSNITFIIQNSSILVSNYSQPNSYTNCLSGANGYTILVKNATNGNLTSTTFPPINSTNITNMTLFDSGHLICAPGRYWNNTFTISATNITGINIENANITVITDIPISTNNTLSNGVGTFSGSLSGNATTYQSYFFNTSFDNSASGNATAIAINLTTSSAQIAQIFLFDNSGTMRAKSINTNTSQYLSYYPLPSSPAIWEIRVYGNSTSSIPYIGAIIYSTLNVTNSSSSNQQIFNISYGKLNVSQNAINNITLINQGILNLSNVAFTDTVYRIQKFAGSSNQNFPFLVGDSNVESKVRVALHWTGNSNYILNVYDPAGNLVMTSSNYNTLAKAAGATSQELYNETTSIVPGYWNVSVVSNSGSDAFNLNISTFENNLQNWISTNYSTTSFNGMNTNDTIQLNLTIPNATIDGSYQGNLLFTDSNGGQIAIPIYFNVTTPTILVLNATYSPTTMNPFSADTFRQDENYGANLTRTINFNISNIGSFDQVIDASLNSTNLTCSSCGFQPTMTSNITNIKYLPAHSSQIFNVTITYNSSFPVNTYYGWIFINATNNTNFVLNSHPYSSYNLTLELNLTNTFPMTVTNLVAQEGGSNPAGIAGESITILLNVTYLNGTLISIPNSLNVNNFQTFWLQERNVTTSLGIVPASGSLSLSNGTNPFWNGTFNINFTLPSPLPPGGQYTINGGFVYNRADGATFTAQTNSSVLIINNTGLFMSTNTTGSGCAFGSICQNTSTISLVAGTSQTIYVNIANYGPMNTSTATINVTNGCASYYTITGGTPSGGCFSGQSGTALTGTFPAFNTSCIITWTINALHPVTTCPLFIMGGGATWFDPNGVNMTITVTNSTTSNQNNNNNNNNQNTGTTAPVYISITNYPSFVFVVQNSTNSTIVVVKNVNNTLTQDIGLSIKNLTTSWYSITPSIQTGIPPFISTNYTISFTIPSSAAVADYLTNLTASSNYGSTSQLFILRVLPSASTKVNINQTYQLAVVNYTNLLSDVNKSKAMGMNTTQVDADLVLAKAKLDQTQSYINSGDYFSAQQSLNQAQSLLATAANDFANLNKNPFTGILSFLQGNLLYIAISGIAVAAVFIAYLFWPIKSESLDLLMKPKKSSVNERIRLNEKVKLNANQESSFQKLKNKWSWENLKNKWKK